VLVNIAYAASEKIKYKLDFGNESGETDIARARESALVDGAVSARGMRVQAEDYRTTGKSSQRVVKRGEHISARAFQRFSVPVDPSRKVSRP
jgi:hypothetical protein